MSKTKHTPGPWHEILAGDIPLIMSNNTVVAEVRPFPEERRIPDTHLIAAAPEMLEALEWCVETFDGLAAVYPSLDNERGFARAKAVIKKAKGENV